MSVRVRFAPSPTGALHVGGARTALFNFLLVKKYGGQFIIRAEDTDSERSNDAYLQEQLDALLWLGLEWDEGPSPSDFNKSKGDHGPYRQSQRLDLYKKYATELLNKEQAYYCFLSDKEIEQMKAKAMKAGKPYRVISPYRDWSLEQAQKEIAKGKLPVIRFKVPTSVKDYVFVDGVRGEVKFSSDTVGDFVIMRSNNYPVYNFCCAVDDALMKITHVLRAEEHLPNTLRQLMILESLNYTPPEYFHLSIILDKERKKLSKRGGASSCLEYRDKGYLPEALNNFLCLLGWNPKSKDEIFQFDDLVQSFSEKAFNSAGAVFDEDKLIWVNSHHLRALPSQKFWKIIEPWLTKEQVSLPKDEKWREQAFESLKSSFFNLKQAVELLKLLSPEYFNLDASSTEIKDWPQTKNVLKEWKKQLEALDNTYLSVDEFKKIRSHIQNTYDVKGPYLFMPLRVAHIGQLKGLELNASIPLIDRKTLIQRAQTVLNEYF